MVIKTYREALDAYLTDPQNYKVDPAWLTTLEQTVHRHFDTGFFFQDTSKPLEQQESKIHAEKTMYKQAKVIAETRDHINNQYLVLEQKNKVERGAVVDLIKPREAAETLVLDQLFDLNKEAIESTPHARMLYLIPYENAEEVPLGSYLRQIIE